MKPSPTPVISKGLAKQITEDITKQITPVAAATYHWLCYVQTSSIANVLAESSIRYPFVEGLERKGYNKICLEAYHPCFNSRKMDVFCGDVNGANIGVADGNAKFYLEFKYVKSYSRNNQEKQRIVNDILRLYFFKIKVPQIHCYFLICGDTPTFTSCFKCIQVPKNDISTIEETSIQNSSEQEPIGFYADLLPFTYKDGLKRFNVSKEMYNCFHKEYFSEKKESREENACPEIYTKLIGLFPQKEELLATQTLAVWEVLLPDENIERE